jgi:hypothetical protein
VPEGLRRLLGVPEEADGGAAGLAVVGAAHCALSSSPTISTVGALSV